MVKTAYIILFLWLCSFSLKAETEVELVTIGAGEFYWEAFGHSAIRIKSGNQDYMYGFGYFNFNDEDFFLNFAKGKMQYFLGIQASDIELDDYTQQNRKIWVQKLKLSSIQKNKLIKQLNYLAKPENRYYPYDYFLNNCTTKIRDILDEATDGEVSKQLKKINTNLSWSDKTFPVANQSWMNLGIAIAYGLPAYKKQNQWNLAVFPEDYAKALASVQTQNNWNTPAKLIYQPKSKSVNSFLKTHFASLLIIGLFLISMMSKSTRKSACYFWLMLQSLIGIGVLFLWFMT
jgi:hypothetical protein